jgi:ubiquinone/menaquinone biosynthesis C-methylase UbiE
MAPRAWRDVIQARARDTTLVDEVFEHWRNNVLTYGGALKATTKTWTAKALELDALRRRLTSLSAPSGEPMDVLEVGCGNGINCLELARSFPGFTFHGVDYVPEMVAAAEENRRGSTAPSQLRFVVGNAMEVDLVDGLFDNYDVVFTDRCLINLASTPQQLRAISAMAAKIRPGGHLVMIENSSSTYEEQNRYRRALGLPARTPATYNLFLDEDEILPHLSNVALTLVDIEDFISLHDLMLYVLVPAINGGRVDYEHPLVEAATKLSVAASSARSSPFGSAGQNRLYFCQKLR